MHTQIFNSESLPLTEVPLVFAHGALPILGIPFSCASRSALFTSALMTILLPFMNGKGTQFLGCLTQIAFFHVLILSA